MTRRRTTRPQRALLTLLSGVLALSLAACGSNLNPEDVNRASGDGGTAASGDGGTAADGGTGAGTDGGAAAGGDPGGGSAAGASGGSAGGEGGSGSGGGSTQGNAPVDPSVKAGSCNGFKNGPGVTNDSITIGNSSDISGPVPGLFETAQDATKAFVSYFNAAVPDGICGRELVLKTYDSKTDASADQQAYAAACDEVFAMVGSVSAFDLGGAKTAQSCGLPDLRGGSVTYERNACTTCFGVQAVNTSFFQNAVPDFVRREYGSSAKKAAFLYTDAGAAAQNAKAQVKAMEKRGMKFVYEQGIPTSEINYTAYVQKMKEEGVEVVFFTTSYQFSARMRQTMKSQQFEPKLYLRDPTDYNPDYVEQSNGAADGTVVFTNFAPFEEAGSNRELATYLGALQQSDPGADPQFFGVFAWSAARLFVQLATQLGAGLTRASLISATRKTNDWTANGLHAPQPVGSKGTGECWRFIQLDGETWKPIGGTKYSCTGLTSTK